MFAKRDYDMMLGSYFSAGDPAIGYTRLYNSYTGTAPNTNAERILESEGRRSARPGRDHHDREARAKLYKELQAILNEDLPTLVLFDEERRRHGEQEAHRRLPALDARDQWAGVKRLD